MADDKHIDIYQAPALLQDLDEAWRRFERAVKEAVSAIEQGYDARWEDRGGKDEIVRVEMVPMVQMRPWRQLRTRILAVYDQLRSLVDDTRAALRSVAEWVAHHQSLSAPPAQAEDATMRAMQVVQILRDGEHVLADVPSTVDQITQYASRATISAHEAEQYRQAAEHVIAAITGWIGAAMDAVGRLLGSATGQVATGTTRVVTRVVREVVQGAGWLILLGLGIYLLIQRGG